MEQAIISGVAHDRSEAKVTVRHVPDRPGVAAALFNPLAEADIDVDMIVQNVSRDGYTDISFTVAKDAVDRARTIAEKMASELEAGAVDVDEHIAKVSLVGAGMKSHPGVAATVFSALAGAGINVEMISTSTIRISCVVKEEHVEDAVRVLHAAFELGEVSA